MILSLENLKLVDPIDIEETDDNFRIDKFWFQIIGGSNDLRKEGVIVLNNLPVKPNGRKEFEARFLNRPKEIEYATGFIAIRIMRPVDSNIYVILTQWSSEQSFRNWQNSRAYSRAHKNRGTDKGIENVHGVLDGKPFHNIYTVSD